MFRPGRPGKSHKTQCYKPRIDVHLLTSMKEKQLEFDLTNALSLKEQRLLGNKYICN